jgi:hypothetical protein
MMSAFEKMKLRGKLDVINIFSLKFIGKRIKQVGCRCRSFFLFLRTYFSCASSLIEIARTSFNNELKEY